MELSSYINRQKYKNKHLNMKRIFFKNRKNLRGEKKMRETEFDKTKISKHDEKELAFFEFKGFYKNGGKAE